MPDEPVDDASADAPAGVGPAADGGGLSRGQARDALHTAALEAMREHLRCDARSWAAQVRTMDELTSLSELGAKAGVPQFGQLEMAGSWSVSQLTATRWQAEAQHLLIALPRTLAMLETGQLLRHQATVLLHRTRHCTAEVARQVEAEVLPAAAGWCPADLGRRVDRLVLRFESERADAAAAEQRHTDTAAERRTFTRPELDGMGLAGAVLTAEQLVGWSVGMDRLERRERLADRLAGIDRTAPQRRADLFAALPAMVLAGTAQDVAARDAARDAAAQTDDTAADEAVAAVAGGCGRPWTLGPELIAAQIILNLHVPVSTVLELSRTPGSLDGYGPVSAEHIRLLRPTALRRVLVDSLTGRPLAVDDRTSPVGPDPQAARTQVQQLLTPAVITDIDEPQHDPSARLARLIDLRDVRCCGPGCSSTRCDRDHLDPWPAGPTSAGNLGLASPRATEPNITAGCWSATSTAASPGPAPWTGSTTAPPRTTPHHESTSTRTRHRYAHHRPRPRPGGPPPPHAPRPARRHRTPVARTSTKQTTHRPSEAA